MNEDLEVKNIGYINPKSQITVPRKYGVSPRELLDIQKKKHERDSAIAIKKAKQGQKDGLNIQDIAVDDYHPRQIDAIQTTELRDMILSFSREICLLYEYLRRKKYTTEEINVQIRSMLIVHLKKFQLKNILDGGGNFSCFVF